MDAAGRWDRRGQGREAHKSIVEGLHAGNRPTGHMAVSVYTMSNRRPRVTFPMRSHEPRVLMSVHVLPHR